MARKAIQTYNKIVIKRYRSTRIFIELVVTFSKITLQISQSNLHLVPGVQSLDINHYPLNNSTNFNGTYLLIAINQADNRGLYIIIYCTLKCFYGLKVGNDSR